MAARNRSWLVIAQTPHEDVRTKHLFIDEEIAGRNDPAQTKTLQFPFYYQAGVEQQGYQPNFVAEATDYIYYNKSCHNGSSH